MKYEKQILEAFDYLEMKPRKNQVEYINKAVEAFIDRKKKYVVLNASTGTGKSIIGAVISYVINGIKKSKLSSIILMHNNALTKQYYNTFSKFDPSEFVQLKGANNYKCTALSYTEKDKGTDEVISAEHCAYVKLKKSGLSEIVDKHCKNCEYKKIKELKNVSSNVITNFSYYFVDRQFSGVFEQRDIVIWDEAHTINDAFCEHNAIFFSKERLLKFYEEISNNLKFNNLDVFKALKKVQKGLEEKLINDSNYKDYLKILSAVYDSVYEQATTLCENSGYDMEKYTKYSKLAKKYFGLGCKIGDLLAYNYEHVFEFNEKELEATVKPIFIGKMFEETLINSSYNLFMSATISKEYLTETLQLKDEDVEFILVPPSFPKENKHIIFYKLQNLNYNSMKDQNVLNKLSANVKELVRIHNSEFGENGIILTPSFALNELIANAVRSLDIPIKVFEHTRGMKADEIIGRFKSSKELGVLISPSIYEGVDLPGDFSRYQIIVKAPFPSLAEKRMKYILENHPNIYNLLTIQKLVQGGGRSVRSEDDYAVTYFLDMNAKRVFSSHLNVWKDEFSISTSN